MLCGPFPGVASHQKYTEVLIWCSVSAVCPQGTSELIWLWSILLKAEKEKPRSCTLPSLGSVSCLLSVKPELILTYPANWVYPQILKKLTRQQFLV